MLDVIQVMHVALQLDTGGLERLLVEFARHADAKRFALRFVSLSAIGKNGTAKEIETCGWPVMTLDARPGLRPSIVYRLARLFQDQRIDIVHAHNTKPLMYAGPAARLAKVHGVVYTRHGQRKGSTRRQNLLYRLTSRCTDRIVCVSEDCRRRCERDRLDARSIRTIWNGVDLERFQFHGPANNGPAVFVGRLSPEKKVETLVRATAIAAGNDATFRLKVAGDGPCAHDLAALTQSLNLGPHVEFLGEVRDVPALLHQASMFVLPSITEGLPLAVLEAMACGLPVVATRVGGTPEAVVEGETGLLAAPESPEQLAQAMLTLHRNRTISSQMGVRGHQRVKKHFDVRKMVPRYETLYDEVLQDASAMAG